MKEQLTKQNTPEELAARCFYFAGTPMLLLNREGTVVEINAALRVLMKTDVAGCKGQSHRYLSKQLEPKLEGKLFASPGIARSVLAEPDDGSQRMKVDDVGVVERTCRYRSPAFGTATLRPVEIPAIHTEDGGCTGSILNVEILQLDESAAYQQALRKRWAHEIMWELYAVSYDRLLRRMPFYLTAVERHCAALLKAGGSAILDIGAGTGSVTTRLLKEGCQVTAVDISRAMLQKLRSNVHRQVDAALRNALTIIEDTAERLPHLKDGSFDGVNVLLAFFDMQDPHAALAEAIRLLRPGGTLAVTEPRERFDVEHLVNQGEQHLRRAGLFQSLSDHWHRVLNVAPQLEAAIQALQTAHSDKPPWHAEALLELLRSQRFVDLTIQDSHHGNCATIIGRKPQ